jgi:glycosyltransferase involved in cell wall biosynthesis
MSKKRRVLIIARHYWPTTTDQTLRLRQWVSRLQREGYEVVVASPRWHDSWPRRVFFDNTHVFRIDHPPITQLRTSRYWRSLIQWVVREQSNFECIYCDSADGDAHALLTQLPRNQQPPILVRFDPQELSQGSVGLWQTSPRCADVCRRSAAVIVPNAAAHQQLLAMGVSKARIHRVADLPASMVDRSPSARSTARSILVNTNHDLYVRSQDRVVVCPGELTRDWGVDFLVDALEPLLEQQRSLRLWVLGDSLERPRIYDTLQFKGLHRIVVMPGMFTCLEQVLQVADLCVFPAAGRGLGWLMPTCIASAIPIVAADSAEAREMLGAQATNLCFASGQHDALRNWMANWLRNAKPANKSIASVREELVRSTDSVNSSTQLRTILESKPSLPEDARI